LTIDTVDPVDTYDATPPAQKPDADFKDASALDENSTHSFPDDDSIPSFSAKDPSSIVPRKRGRPRRQIPAVKADPLKIEPKRELRRRRPAGEHTEDPWVILSKAPSITPLSPKKPHLARPPTQKPVIDLPSCPYTTLFLNIFQPGVPKKNDA
jgi:hypothetical protein